MATTEHPINPTFLPARAVWERYSVTSMTLHRWLRDPRVDFPRPVVVGRLRYFKLADLERWEAARTDKGKAEQARRAPAAAPVEEAAVA